MPRMADPVGQHFADCLTAKERSDGNRLPTVAKGDCCIMLQMIRMKLTDFEGAIDVSNPGRFRGTAGLIEDMKAVLGDVERFHVPKWGASHVRGALREDTKRGNKRHLIKMVELLNAYSGTEAQLRKVYSQCIRAHHEFFDNFSITVTVQKSDAPQARLIKLLSVPSFGRVQQGLVYSALVVRYGGTFRVTTKKTFAGDEQSSQTGETQRGDIQVWNRTTLLFAIEVKDAVVDQVVWNRVAATHGEHDYPLLILGSRFEPAGRQGEISSFRVTYAVHLVDFVLSLFALTAIEQSWPPQVVLERVLSTYNAAFCDEIECDPSIKINIAEI